MHKTSGLRDPAASFPLPGPRDDAGDRRQANRAIAVSALGLTVTGLIELLLAILTGSVGLLGDAIHNLSDVSTSAVVFLGFRLSRRAPHRALSLRPGTGRGPGRHRDRRGHLGQRGLRRIREHPQAPRARPHHALGAGIAGAVIGILGNQIVARYKLVVGRRINSATLIADARHSWLDALSSAGALAGLIAVALGQPWGDPVAGLAVTAFICHVGWEVTGDVVHRLADGIDPAVITGAEPPPGAVHGRHARARPGPVDGADPPRRDRGLGRPGPAPSVTRTTLAARSRRPGPGSPRRGHPHLGHPPAPAQCAPPRGRWKVRQHARSGARARCRTAQGNGQAQEVTHWPVSHRTAPDASRMTRTEVC